MFVWIGRAAMSHLPHAPDCAKVVRMGDRDVLVPELECDCKDRAPDAKPIGKTLNCPHCGVASTVGISELEAAFRAGWRARGDACYPTPIAGELEIAWKAWVS